MKRALKPQFLIKLLLVSWLLLGIFSVSETALAQIPPQIQKEAAQTEKAAEVSEASVKKMEKKLQEMEKKLETKKALLKKKTAKKPEPEEINGKWILEKAIAVSIIILIGLGVYLTISIGYRKFNRFISDKDAIRESDSTLRLKTILSLGYWLATIATVGLVGYMILREFGVDVAPLLAGMGIVGLAFGFGGQYLIRDIISGIFILLEDQYHINHVVKIGDLAGLVEKINLRVTILRDLEGRAIFIPNGEIKSVINFTKEWSRALFNVGVAYKENVDHVMEVIKQLGAEMKNDEHFGQLILDDLHMLGVDSFGDSQVTIKFYIKTIPIKQWEVAREFNRRLKNKFDELGIEIPFPHRTLYLGAGSDNDSVKKFFEAQANKA